MRSYLPSLGQSNRDWEIPVSAKRLPSFFPCSLEFTTLTNKTLLCSKVNSSCVVLYTLLHCWDNGPFFHAKFCLNITYVIAVNSHIIHIKYSIEISLKIVTCFDIVLHNSISLLFWFDQHSSYDVTSWKLLRSMLILGKVQHWCRVFMLLTAELQFIWKGRFTVLSA